MVSVVPTYHEPVEGWSNNVFGANGVMVGGTLGILRVLHCDSTQNANIVPADMTVNSLIASAWDVRERFSKAEECFECPVYNYESWSHKVISIGFAFRSESNIIDNVYDFQTASFYRCSI